MKEGKSMEIAAAERYPIGSVYTSAYFTSLIERERKAFIAGWQAAQQEGWIDVKDRLPEENQNILCASDKKEDVFTDMYWYSKKQFFGFGYPRAEPSVTHWMPLPPAPPQSINQNKE